MNSEWKKGTVMISLKKLAIKQKPIFNVLLIGSILSLILFVRGMLGITIDNQTKAKQLAETDQAVQSIEMPFEGGRIKQILVKPNQHISKGTVVALLERQELENKLQLEKRQLHNLQSIESSTRSAYEKDRNLHLQYIELQKQHLKQALSVNSNNISDIEGTLKLKEENYKQGLTILQDIEITRRDYYSALQRQEDLQYRLHELLHEQESFDEEWQIRVLNIKERLQSQQAKVNYIQAELKASREVRSPVTGKIKAIYAENGSVIPQHGKIVSITQP